MAVKRGVIKAVKTNLLTHEKEYDLEIIYFLATANSDYNLCHYPLSATRV